MSFVWRSAGGVRHLLLGTSHVLHERKCCGVLSVLGIFFLFSVGHMFAVQPMFTDVEVWEEHHDHDASVNCYLGGVFYVVTLAVSLQRGGGTVQYTHYKSVNRKIRKPSILPCVEPLMSSSKGGQAAYTLYGLVL